VAKSLENRTNDERARERSPRLDRLASASGPLRTAETRRIQEIPTAPPIAQCRRIPKVMTEGILPGAVLPRYRPRGAAPRAASTNDTAPNQTARSSCVPGLVPKPAGQVAQAGEGRAPGASLRPVLTTGGRGADLAEPLRPGQLPAQEALRRLSLPAAGSRPGAAQ